MRKQLFTTFNKLFTKNITKNSKATFKFTSAMLLASSFTFFKNQFNNSVQNATQEPNAIEEVHQQSHKIAFEPFSEDKYQEALNNKQDIVVFLSPDAWIESMVDEVHQVLTGLTRYQAKTRGRKIKFFTINFNNKEEKAEFERKHGVSVGRDSIFLLKNRYSNNMRNFSLEDWFENQRLLLAYFTRMRKLTAKNFEAFSNSLIHVDSDARVFLAYIPKTAENYKELARSFGKLAIHYGAESGGEINSLLINDPAVAEKLGMKPEQAGKMFMVSKASKYNAYQSTINVGKVNLSLAELPVEINSSLEKIKKSLGQFYRENFTFMKGDFGDVEADYTLVLQVDVNKLKKSDLNQYIDAFINVHKELKTKNPELFNNLKIVKYNQSMPKGNHRIYLQDNKSRTEDLYAKYYNKKPLTEDIKKTLEERNAASFEYEFPEETDVTKENLIKFIQEAKEGKIPQAYVGQSAPAFQKYSTRVVQNTYKSQVLDVDKHHAVFLCTKHCPGCKFMGRYFEQYALENLRNPNSDIQFDRINSEKNNVEYLPNFPYTPVFLVLNKQDRTKPFVYKIQYSDPQLLKDFIDITTSQQFIDENVAKNIFENRQKNKDLLANLKLAPVQE